jgi:hypothetical protein
MFKLDSTRCHIFFLIFDVFLLKYACLASTYTELERYRGRLAWPLRKDGTQNREAFHILGIASSISVQSLTLFISNL